VKLSGTVAALSEVPSLMADLIVDDDAKSTTDSVTETRSVFSDASSTGVSHVSKSHLWTQIF
jgi:hypothetical protein